MHSSQVYTVEQKFDESKISKLCFKTCMSILWEMRQKGEFSQFDTIKIIVDGPSQEYKDYRAEISTWLLVLFILVMATIFFCKEIFKLEDDIKNQQKRGKNMEYYEAESSDSELIFSGNTNDKPSFWKAMFCMNQQYKQQLMEDDYVRYEYGDETSENDTER